MLHLWLPCKVCKKWHSLGLGSGGGKVAFATLPPGGKVECPDCPGAFASYTPAEIVEATEEEIKARKHPSA